MPHSTSTLFPLNGGINFAFPPHRLPPQFSPRLRNIRIRDGSIRNRPGQRLFNDSWEISLASGTYNTGAAGAIVSLFQYRRTTGTVETIAITGGATAAERTIYKVAAANWDWLAAVVLTNNDGTTDMKGDAFTPYDAAIAPSGAQTDILYMSNGSSDANRADIIKYTGTGQATPVTTAPGSARTLATFANRLILGHVHDGTEFRGTRVHWSAFGLSEDFADASSNFVDLVETPDLITRLEPLRGRLIIYKEFSIFIARETGISNLPMAFTQFTNSVGTSAPFSVVKAANRHFFLGQDNFYTFDGATVPQTIGNPVRRDLKNINPVNLRQVTAVADESNSEVWFFVPEGASTAATAAWIYNYAENTWNRWEFLTPVSAVGRAVTAQGETWASIDGTIIWGPGVGSIGGSWDAQETVGAPTQLLATKLSTVYRTDEITDQVLDERAAPLTSTWESRDVDFAGQPGPEDNHPLTTSDLKTLSRIVVRFRGGGAATTLQCEVSTNAGATFSQAFPAFATIPIIGGTAVFDTWITAEKFRIRLLNNAIGETFPGIEELVLHYIPREPRR